jgi:hypothetical protein
MQRRFKIAICILIVLIVFSTGFVVWPETPASPMPEAIEALKSDSSVTVVTRALFPTKNNQLHYEGIAMKSVVKLAKVIQQTGLKSP